MFLLILLVLFSSFCYADPVDIGDGLIHGDGIDSATNPYWLNKSFLPVPGGAAWGCKKLRNGKTEEEWLNDLHWGFNVYRFYWMPPQPPLFLYDFHTVCHDWDIMTLREHGCTGCITHYLEYFPQEHGWRYVPIEDYGYGKLAEPSFDVDIFRVLVIIAYFIAFTAGFYVGQRIFWY